MAIKHFARDLYLGEDWSEYDDRVEIDKPTKENPYWIIKFIYKDDSSYTIRTSYAIIVYKENQVVEIHY